MALLTAPTGVCRTPGDWLRVIEYTAASTITAFGSDERFKVGKVKYEVGGAVGPDEACLGVLCLDVANWTATGDPWPNPRRPDGPSEPCGAAVSMNVVLRYVTCVPSMQTSGAPPAEAAAAAAHLDIMDLAWAVFEAFLSAEKPYQRSYGRFRTGLLNRLPDGAGASGFTMQIACKLATQGC